MPAEPDATRQGSGADEPAPETGRLTLSRRETLGGASAAALMAALVGWDPPAEAATARGEPWDDDTFWDDGTGWV